MTTQLGTDAERTANGGRPPAPPGPEASDSSDARPNGRPFRWLRRNGRKGQTEAANGGPERTNGGRERRPRTEALRTDERTHVTEAGPERRPATEAATEAGTTEALNGGASVLPRGYGVAFLVLVFTTVTAGIFSFLFSFGNVRSVAIMLGVPGWIQPLISPAVDVTVIGLIIVIQFLIMAGVHPKRLRGANALLIAAGIAMMAANTAPSIILGLATDSPALYGRAALEGLTPALLIWWSHVGPQLVHLFVEVRERALARVHQAAVQRTIATEADRAAAAIALTEAQREADALRARVAEELAAAASVRQREEEAAAASARERTEAERRLVDDLAARERTTVAQLADRERSSGTEAARRMRAAELLAARAESELTEARRLVAQAAADRAAAASERDAAAADKRAAEELLATASVPERRPERTRERTAPPPPPQRDNETVTSTSGRLSVARRVEMWQEAHPDWASVPTPTQADIKEFFPGLNSADTISKVRQHLDDAKAAA